MSSSIGLFSGLTGEKYVLTVTYTSNFSKVLTEQSYKFWGAFNSKEIVVLKHVNNICSWFSHDCQSASLVENSKTISQGNTNTRQSLCHYLPIQLDILQL